MKFNVAFGLAAALALAPNAVALDLFGNQQDATPTTGAQPSGIVPSGLPQGSDSRFGTVPSGVAGGAQPSGGFGGHHGHHGHHGGQGGFPSGGAQPSGSFGGFGQGGESGAASTAVPSGAFTVPEASSSSEGTQSFQRIHARQIRPFAI